MKIKITLFLAFAANLLLSCVSMQAVTVDILKEYGLNPRPYYSTLIRASDGNFYGTSMQGGANALGGSGGQGTVFKLTPEGKLTVLVSFSASRTIHGDYIEGRSPGTALVEGNDGAFYGTTRLGGAGGGGTIFKMTPSGELTTLVRFNGLNGDTPATALIKAEDGNFYGATTLGGVHNYGTIFKLTPVGVFTTVLSMSHENRNPGTLIQGDDGNFYGISGTSVYSGGRGTVFKMTPEGVLTTLSTFDSTGVGQFTQLVQGNDGNFYCTGKWNGKNGTIYRITPTGTMTTIAVLTESTGRDPSELVRGADGNFYATTWNGGINNKGTIIRVTPTGVVTTIAAFNTATGSSDISGLVAGGDGDFYGLTYSGGLSPYGSFYRVSPAGVISVIAGMLPADGHTPFGELVLGVDGYYYGTTSAAGSGNGGTVFRMSADGSTTNLWEFNGADGRAPLGQMVFGNDGNLYGTTSQGGTHNFGTVFKITPSGLLTTLMSFDSSNGREPWGALTKALDGTIYGTTLQGGLHNRGTVFKITTEGMCSSLVSFGPSDGRLPYGGLAQANDGDFYGTTWGGGANEIGTIYRVTSEGTLTTILSFNGANGQFPRSRLCVASDGELYGTTWSGGANTNGTVFKVTTAGALNTLFSFPGHFSGGYPSYAGLSRASDGNLYGTTHTDLFRVTPGGTFEALYQFTDSILSLRASLIEGADGRLYGTAHSGGSNGGGLLFAVTLNQGPLDVRLDNATVTEAMPVGTPVGKFVVTDPDSADVHTVELVSGDDDEGNSAFTIDGSLLKTAAILDYEIKSNYSIRVKVTDQAGVSTEKVISIAVSDINIVLDNRSIDENVAIGTEIGGFVAADPESGTLHTYSLVSGEGADDNGSFVIEQNTLRTAANLDFETRSNYSVRVRGEGDSTVEQVMVISVIDKADAPTDITWFTGVPGRFYPAFLSISFSVGALRVTDEDAGDTHTFALVGGAGSADNGAFTIEGSNLKGIQNFNYEFKRAYSIRIRVTDSHGLSFEKALSMIATADDSKMPSVRISYPMSGQRITNDLSITLSGTASSKGFGIQEVFYSVNGSSFQRAQGTTNWSADITLRPGVNSVDVYAQDYRTARTHVRRSFSAVFFSPLTLSSSGAGTLLGKKSPIGTPVDGAILEVGQAYGISARAGAGTIFSNWSGHVTSENANLVFIMQSNMVLQANFVSNPYLTAAGIYNGLFYEDDEVRHHSGGFLTMKVNTNMSYSGKIMIDGDTLSVSGKLPPHGSTTKTVVRSKQGKPNLTLSFDLNLPSGGPLVGTMDSGGSWVAPLQADQAHYGPTNNIPAQYVGRYTALLPRGMDPELEPGGFGYGLVALDTNGIVKLESSRLGDGHFIKQKVALSHSAEWPLYIPLYRTSDQIVSNMTSSGLILKTNKEYQGSILGWVTFSTNSSGIMQPSGTLSWIKKSWTNDFYQGGFTNHLDLAGSKYVSPAPLSRLLTFSDGIITMEGENLGSSLQGSFLLSEKNTAAVVPVNQFLRLVFVPKTGHLNGEFVHPLNGITKYFGVVLQSDDIAGGFFEGTNQTGSVWIEAD